MKREFEIFKYLINNPNNTTIEELADYFMVSTRSIRNDLNSLNSYLEGTEVRINRNRNNVEINKNALSSADISQIMDVIREKSDFYSNEDRFHIVMQTLLMETPCSIQSLSDQIKVARSATIRTLAACEKWLNNNRITVERKANKGIHIVYDERSYRKACINYISGFFKDIDYQWIYNDIRNDGFILFNIWANDFIQSFIRNINLEAVKSYIRNYEEEQEVRFTDESFILLFFVICVSLKRVINGRTLDEEMFEGLLTELPDLDQWLETKRQFFLEEMNIMLSDAELKNILVWFLGTNKRYMSEKGIGMYNERLLIDRFIGIIENCLAVDLSQDSDLRKNLEMHMTPTIHRMMYGIHIENLLKESIKQEYPEIYRACEKGCMFIKEQTGVMPNEDEIAFLTMHIAVSVEKNRVPARNLNVYRTIVLCTSGVATSNMLAVKLANAFPNIIIERICSVDDFNDNDSEDVDFIVSTIPFISRNDKPVFYVSPLLRENEADEIRRFMAIDKANGGRQSNRIEDDIVSIVKEVYGDSGTDKLRTKIHQYFSSSQLSGGNILLSDFAKGDTVQIIDEAGSPKEIISKTCSLLVKNGSVTEEYIDALLESKQQMGDSIAVAEGVVLAHAKISSSVIRTAFSFSVLRKPLAFGIDDYDPIRLVIVLSAAGDNRHLLSLSELQELIEDEETLKDLYTSENAEQFRKVLIDFENSKFRKG